MPVGLVSTFILQYFLPYSTTYILTVDLDTL